MSDLCCRTRGRPLPRLLVWPLVLVGALYLTGAHAFNIVVQPAGGGGISTWTYLVNEDNSADPWDPDPANHPSLHQMASHSPILAAGDQSTTSVNGLACPGRYLISVRAPGYKLWGKHVRLDGACQLVEVGFGGAVTVLPDQADVHAIHPPYKTRPPAGGRWR